MSGLFHELKRRNVIKIAIVYAVVAWLIAQVISVVHEPLHLPNWFPTAVIVLLIAGFPIALIIAWAFERGVDGVHRTPPTKSPAASTDTDASEVAPMPEDAAVDEDSVAVLPFVNMSSDPEQEYFSDGISEELLNQLAKVRDLHVAGRTSSFQFKGHVGDFADIAKRLKVAHILEGSVRKAGNRVRVTAQLIKADNGYHLWSETYDREMDDIFAIQDEIAHAVTSALSVTLGVGDTGVSTHDVAAYDQYLVARGHMAEGGRDSFLKAADALEKATQLDPAFIEAWVSMASNALYLASAWAAERDAEFWEQFERAVRQARAIDPDNPGAVHAAALLALNQRRWIEAGERFEAVVSAAPSTHSLLSNYQSFLMSVGRFRDATEVVRQWVRVDPLFTQPMSILGVCLEHAGELDQAREAFRQAAELAGNVQAYAGPRLVVSLTMGDAAAIRADLDMLIANGLPVPGHQEITVAMGDCLGDPVRARQVLREFLGDTRYRNALMLSVMATWASYFRDPELALQMLKKLERLTTNVMVFTMWRPLHREMRRLPGFKDLVRDAGLVDYWRTTGHWGDYVRPVGDDDFEVIG